METAYVQGPDFCAMLLADHDCTCIGTELEPQTKKFLCEFYVNVFSPAPTYLIHSSVLSVCTVHVSIFDFKKCAKKLNCLPSSKSISLWVI